MLIYTFFEYDVTRKSTKLLIKNKFSQISNKFFVNEYFDEKFRFTFNR